MPTHSPLKKLKDAYEAHKPQLRRQVISFDEALERLKTSQNAFVNCAVSSSLGNCRRKATLFDSNSLANLNQLNMADVQTPIKLMPFILCPTHWKKTVYYNAMFLDWLSTYGSKQDNQHYENIVIDYQSAIAIDSNEHPLPETSDSSNFTTCNQRQPNSPPMSPVKDRCYTTSLQNTDEPHIHRDHNKLDPLEHEQNDPKRKLSESLVLVSRESYASIEFGVAKLEIIYQESLKCIAMTSEGWRCQEVIPENQLLRARELLSSLLMPGPDLPRLVLCPGHTLGELPQIYFERWTVFAEQKLSKEEAMSKFNAEFWMTIEFFKAERGLRSASNISIGQSSHPGGSPPEAWFDFHRNSQDIFTFSPSNNSPDFDFTKLSKNQNLDRGWHSSEMHPASDTSAELPVSLKTSTSASQLVSVPVPSPTSGPPSTSNNLEDGANTSSEMPALMTEAFTDLRLTEELPQPEADFSSVPKAIIEETIPLKDQIGTQSAELATSSTPSFSKGAVQPSIQICSQDIVDSNLIRATRLLMPRDGVYMFKSRDGKLVKILDHLPFSDMQTGYQLQEECGHFVSFRGTNHPKRVAKLVHTELQNFLVETTCKYQHHGASAVGVEQRDEEWFDVPISVAVNSVKLWCSFVDKAYAANGVISTHWWGMGNSLPKPTFLETFHLQMWLETGNVTDINEHHVLRRKRYMEWITE